MTPEQAEVQRAFRILRRHLPQSLRGHEAQLEAAWFNGGPLPVDWLARFRAAAEVAGPTFWDAFNDLANDMERRMPSRQVEAIGRALLGEEE